MKVLVIYHAGAMQAARDIFKELQRSNPAIQLTVAVPERLKVDRIYDPTGWVLGRNHQNGYRMTAIPLRDPERYHRGFGRQALRRLLATTKPDIIHVLDESNSGYLFQVVWERLTTAPRSKVLFYAFDNLPLRLKLPSRLKWGLTWRQIAGGAGASSEALERLRLAGFPQDRPLERIFWAVETATFRPLDRAAVKNELRLDFGNTIGFVGRLAEEKGVRVLLAALRRMPRSSHALLIGDGPMRGELQEAAGSPELQGRLHLVSPVPAESLVRYFNCMDVVALPSLTMPAWKEQYGRVIGEAMACGVPVVGSSSGAIPEVIGDGGIVVPEGDAQSLAGALRRVLEDRHLRESLAKRALERAVESLSTHVMARKLGLLYRRVLEG